MTTIQHILTIASVLVVAVALGLLLRWIDYHTTRNRMRQRVKEMEMETEIQRLQAEVADLKSREVILFEDNYYGPLAITNGTWEWFAASKGCGFYLGHESLHPKLYAALPGVNLDKVVMTYPTREAAMDALRQAIASVMGQNQ